MAQFKCSSCKSTAPLSTLSLNSTYHGQQEIILALEEDILPARSELALGGFFVEHTTAATYAAYKDYTSKNKLEGDSLIPLCGAGLKSEK